MKKNIDNFKIFYSSFLGKAVSEILSKKISKLWNPIDKSRIAVIGFGSPYSESINKRIQRLFFLIPRHHGKYHFGLTNKNLTTKSKQRMFVGQLTTQTEKKIPNLHNDAYP